MIAVESHDRLWISLAIRSKTIEFRYRAVKVSLFDFNIVHGVHFLCNCHTEVSVSPAQSTGEAVDVLFCDGKPCGFRMPAVCDQFILCAIEQRLQVYAAIGSA